MDTSWDCKWQYNFRCFLQTIVFRSMNLSLKGFCLSKEPWPSENVLCTWYHSLSDPSLCLSVRRHRTSEHLVVCLLTETASSMWTYEKYSILSFHSIISESILDCSSFTWGVIALFPLGSLYCHESQRLEEGLSDLGWKGLSLFRPFNSVWPGQEGDCRNFCASSAASAIIPEEKWK